MNRDPTLISHRDQHDEELRQYVSRLEATNLQLQQANQHKSRFLSSMSHELRTPLSSIVGFSDLLRGEYYGFLNEKQLVYVDQIEESAKHLLNLINDLLDITKIDAGRMDVRLGPFSWDALICSSTSMMSTQFNQKGLSLHVEVDEMLKRSVIGDEKLCRQILFNLLSNAVKFTTEDGKVEIQAISENGGVRVSVSDTGIGIPSDQLEDIFSEFHQVDCPSGRHQDGAGIGLALTRRLVELLGGRVYVESEPGKGSTFSFTLPLRFLEANKRNNKPVERQEVSKAGGRGHFILVAEDNEANKTMILDMLATQGHTVVAACNGMEAVDMACRLRPDLILMDIKMPVMDGLEATRRIRRIPELSETPIIALTACAGQQSVEQCLAAGFCNHLSKPVHSEELFATLETYMMAYN
jgi:CheY-like chemotaxis protein/nitrogen-specific signal transduction histidine kinase